jgi:hypothetical protein
LNPKLLEPEIQEFIIKNEGIPATQLALKKNPFPYIEWAEVINQVAAREKAKTKLPTWYAAKNIIYPSKTSVEQTSSEVAARYKASLISGHSLIDLTGGFGIDDYYFSKKVNEVAHCELNLELSAIAAHNFKELGADNIQCVPGDSTDALRLLNRQWDWMYIDPSRRHDAKGKVFMLKDCLPNVPSLLDFYFRFTNNIMVKTAPLLDISAGLGELHSVKAIHVVAINNEVKELLWILEKGYNGSPMLETIDINKGAENTFATIMGTEAEAQYGLPKKYLYEPNSAIMKSGAFNTVSTHFSLEKLHQHSHLYTSDKHIAFPGRCFAVNSIVPYTKAEIKKHIEGKKMNISTRNFPLSADELQKKWKIKDGGDIYAFFTTNRQNEKIVLLCAKI